MPDVSFVNLLVVALVAVLAPLLSASCRGCGSRPSSSRSSPGSWSARPCWAGSRSTCRYGSWPCSGWPSCCSWPGWRSTCGGCAVGCSGWRRARLPVTLVLGLGVGRVLTRPAGCRARCCWRSPCPRPRSASSCRCSRTPADRQRRRADRRGRGDVADFAAILLLSLFFSTSGGSTGAKLVLLGAFAGWSP